MTKNSIKITSTYFATLFATFRISIPRRRSFTSRSFPRICCFSVTLSVAGGGVFSRRAAGRRSWQLVLLVDFSQGKKVAVTFPQRVAAGCLGLLQGPLHSVAVVQLQFRIRQTMLPKLVQVAQHLFSTRRTRGLIFRRRTLPFIRTRCWISSTQKVRQQIAQFVLVIATPITQCCHNEHITVHGLSS